MVPRREIPNSVGAPYAIDRLSYEGYYTGEIAAQRIPWALGTFSMIVHEKHDATPLPLDDLGTSLADPSTLRWVSTPADGRLAALMADELALVGEPSWIAFDDGVSQASSPWGSGSQTAARPVPIHGSFTDDAELLIVDRGATELELLEAIQYADKA